MTALKDTYTSSGMKLFFHQEAMQSLRAGKGRCITTHVLPTDLCQHSCGFCSVQTRHGDTLPLDDIFAYLDILLKYGLSSVIVSGGGNPILYKCPKTGRNFNDLIDGIHARNLQIGLITNGLKLRKFHVSGIVEGEYGMEFKQTFRESWGTVRPETLDKLTWVRVSLAGLDHEENECYIPDIDPEKTTLGMSYIFHDLFDEPADTHHGKVSTPADLITLGKDRLNLKPTRWANDRVEELTEQIRHYVTVYKPKYVRLLPNCLQPDMIEDRCATLRKMADAIDPNIVFVQHKPPKAPKNCWLGYVHPVLNACGGVFPCDSVTLAAADLGYKSGHPEHSFANPWRLCHWSEVSRLYEEPIHSLVDSQKMCGGCVFSTQNAILEGVVDGTADLTPPAEVPEHANFV